MDFNKYQFRELNNRSEINGFLKKWEESLSTKEPLRIQQHPSQISKLSNLTLFTISKNDVIQCIIPCLVESRGIGVKLGLFKIFSIKVNSLRLIGDDLIFECHSGIKDCIEIFLNHLSNSPEYDCLVVESIRETSELFQILKKTPSYFVSHAENNNIVRQLTLNSNHDEYLSNIKRKVRYNLKRTVKLFTENFGNNVELVEYTTPDQVNDLLNQVDIIYNKSWQKNIKGELERNSNRSVLQRQSQAKNAWLRSYVLFCENKPIAFVLGTQFNGLYDYEETGYDPKYANFSPGTVMNYMIIQRLFEFNKPDIIDFGFGENTYKKVFGNHAYTAFNMTAAKTKGKLHAALIIQQLLNKCYHSIRSYLIKWKLDTKVRNLIKRKT
ncbi:GNAT family N-acetyltransferase [Thalassotalea crassostreae]|uniref:GNAT family N-acetyltransferase n=1 Tax=Thalassotalea crassostreae TaxID=1763536 RepID=UPI000838F555|nr:GNAT family N-acetyltransferase [Thalassotalea crassostreae]